MRHLQKMLPLLCLLAAGPALAQTPPSANELQAYQGLHGAAAKGDIGAILKLSSDSFDLNSRDGNGRTPLHVAAFQKQRAAISALIAAGADHAALDKQKYDAVTIASVADDPQTLKVLLDAGASAKLTTSVYDGTALIAAAHLGHDECVRLLIKAGAPLDHVNNLHWTAMIEAVVLGDGGKRHQATLQHLLDAGARKDLVDAQGQTPLMLAKARGYSAMVQMLERKSAK